MSIKFRCPNCQHGIKAPDNAAGKAVRCPQCSEKARVPSGSQKARPRKKPAAEPASPPDSDDFLANIDLGKADAGVELCQKCAAEIPPDETTCPECGFDPFELTAVGMKRKKLAAKGIDPQTYYEKLWKEPFSFTLSHTGMVIKTGMILTFFFLLSAFCGYFLIWVATGPPFGFWVLLTTVSAMIPVGWLLVQHLEIIRLTMERKDKIKKLRFDFALCGMTGLKFFAWVLIFGLPFWLIFGGLGMLLDMSGITVGLGIGFGLGAMFLLLFTPQAMSHLAMPVESPGWVIYPRITNSLGLTFMPALLWAVLFFLVSLPVIGGGAIVYFVGGEKFEEFVDIRFQQAKIHRARVEIDLATDSGNDERKASAEEAWGEFAALDAPTQNWSSIVLPISIGVVSCFFLSFASIVVARANGLFTTSLRKGLDLIGSVKEYKYVKKEKEEKHRTRKTTVPAPPTMRFLAFVIDSLLITVLNSSVLGMIYYVVASFDVDMGTWTARIIFLCVVNIIPFFAVAFYFINNESGIDQTTPGKAAFNMFLASDERCTPISTTQAIIRFLSFYFLAGILTLFIGCMMAAFRKDRKALHDLISGTEVRMDKPKPKQPKQEDKKS